MLALCVFLLVSVEASTCIDIDNRNQPAADNLAPLFNFNMHMESPMIAFPKYPGSFELLVANLGEITICNQQNKYSAPFDKLNIKIVDMSLRSHRQKEEEKNATMKLKSYGVSISDLKRTR